MPKNGQPGRNGQTLRKAQLSETEPGRNRKYKQTNHKHWNRNSDKNSSNKKSPGQDVFTGEFYQTLEKS